MTQGSRLNNVLCFIAAFCMPNNLLFDLYNRNRVANHIIFNHVLILAGVLAIVGFLLFKLFKWIAGSTEGGLMLAIIFWLCFRFFEALIVRESAVVRGLAQVGLSYADN